MVQHALMKDGAVGAGGDKEVVRGKGIVGLLPEEEGGVQDMTTQRTARGGGWETNRV